MAGRDALDRNAEPEPPDESFHGIHASRLQSLQKKRKV
jgi:hypothetical protein